MHHLQPPAVQLQNKSRKNPGPMFFAAYTGPSMIPTLREPEIMEILPYDDRPLRVGDVAFFLPPGGDQPVVHRIVRVTTEGIATLGDNNTITDSLLLQAGNIKGQVVAAWRGQKRRKITGGFQGRFTNRLQRLRRLLDRGASPLLHPLYKALSYRGLIALLLPARFRPRIVVFRARNRDQFQLIVGRRVVGRYDDQAQLWKIQRPFHLLVDGRTLPGRKDKDRSKRQALPERRRAINHLLTQKSVHTLVLADGSQWNIAAGDVEAELIVSRLGSAMQLGKAAGAGHPPPEARLNRLVVQVAEHTSVADCYVPIASEEDRSVVCILSPCSHWGGPYMNLVRLSLIFAREAQLRGGLLIHGALAEKDGTGVILAAPGGTGKTTASNRFPPPWRSLCDDTTLVVRDPQGNYRAHPWPTWSRFQDGGRGGTWNVQDAVPVKGIFFLSQAVEDRVERIGHGQTVNMLGESVRQVSALMAPGLFEKELHSLHLERLDNLCALTNAIPAHVLHISLTGAFWQKIEQALEDDRIPSALRGGAGRGCLPCEAAPAKRGAPTHRPMAPACNAATT